MSDVNVAVAGLGYWGPNLARNFDDLARLTWICDASAEQLEKHGPRFPTARATSACSGGVPPRHSRPRWPDGWRAPTAVLTQFVLPALAIGPPAQPTRDLALGPRRSTPRPSQIV